MALHRVPDVDRQHLFPVPVGTLVAMLFRVDGYDPDPGGWPLARVEHVDAIGADLGWGGTEIGVYPDTAWRVEESEDLDTLADHEDSDTSVFAEVVGLLHQAGFEGEAADSLGRQLLATIRNRESARRT